jgi:hypothetical protein
MATPDTAINVPVEVEFDPFASASDPSVETRTYDLFGVVEISAWACHLQKGVGKVPFDAANPDHKRMTAIDVFIQPLPEMDVKYPKTLEDHWIAEFPTWAKITLTSIKAAGFENVREINGKWARVTRVDSLDKPFDKKDAQGNPTGEKTTKKTMKFVEFYDTEEACRAAYLANGGKSAEANAPVADPADAEKTAAVAFLKVIVANACKGKTLTDDWKGAINTALTQYPTVAKFFNADSTEVTELVMGLNLLGA